MRKFDTKVQYLKYKVLREVARLAWNDSLLENLIDIPKTIIPGKEAVHRCCVYKERAILGERVKLALGGDKNNPNVIEVIEIACDECPVGGFEVTNAGYGETDSEANSTAYRIWVDLINSGRRIWATCGGDGHSVLPYFRILTTLYAVEKKPEGYLDQMKVGDMTAGPAGIRIAVGNTATGGKGGFAGNRVVIAAGDFHPQAIKEDHVYRLDVYDETGLLFSQEISTTEMNYFALDARTDALYYRANIYDVTANRIFAVGNPVWNG